MNREQDAEEPEAAPAMELDATEPGAPSGSGEGVPALGPAAPGRRAEARERGGPTVPAEPESAFMSESEEKLAEANDRYLRLMADFDNFRKRSAKERLDAQAYAVEEVIREIIPVVDNLERALASAQEGSGTDGVAGVIKGVELTLRMFQGVLGKFGVERISAVGKPFDPNQHEALLQMETDEVTVETVAEELEPGYTMKGRIVRPARVKVLKPRTAAPPAPAQSGRGESGADAA